MLVAALAWWAGAPDAQDIPLADTGCTNNTDPPCPNMFLRGETINYRATIINPSPPSEEDVIVEYVEYVFPNGSSIVLYDSSVEPELRLLPGQDIAYDATDGLTWTIPLDWPSGADVTSVFRSNGYQVSTLPDPYNCDVAKGVLLMDPCVEITKTPDNPYSKPGDPVIWTICIKNCGDAAPANERVSLVLASVVDDLLGDITSHFGIGVGEVLTPGEEICYTTDPYIVPDGAPDPLVNTVEVHCNPTAVCGGQPQVRWDIDVSDVTTASVDIVHPDYEVTKTCLTIPVAPGDPADFEIMMTNTGDVDLVIVWTNEPGIVVPFTLPQGGGPWSQTVTKTAPDPIPDPPEFWNTVNVTAQLPPEYGLDNELDREASHFCPMVDCCLDVTKEAVPLVTKAGHVVDYEICVINCGTNCDLELVSVIDDLLGDKTADFGGPGAVLADGAPPLCRTFPYTVPDGTPSPLVNTVTATYVGEDGQTLVETSTAEVRILHPGIDVTKECLTDPVPAGADAEFRITITNTGDVDLVAASVLGNVAGGVRSTE